MYHMVSHQFSKDRKDELEKVITQRSWKIDLALAHFEGPHEKVKAEGRQGERGRTWAHAFIGIHGWNILGVPGLRLDRPIQTRRSRVLVSSLGVLPKGHTRGRSWEAGETILSPRALGKSLET